MHPFLSASRASVWLHSALRPSIAMYVRDRTFTRSVFRRITGCEILTEELNGFEAFSVFELSQNIRGRSLGRRRPEGRWGKEKCVPRPTSEWCLKVAFLEFLKNTDKTASRGAICQSLGGGWKLDTQGGWQSIRGRSPRLYPSTSTCSLGLVNPLSSTFVIWIQL